MTAHEGDSLPVRGVTGGEAAGVWNTQSYTSAIKKLIYGPHSEFVKMRRWREEREVYLSGNHAVLCNSGVIKIWLKDDHIGC